MMDALGFKGIWKSHQLDDVMAKMTLLHTHARRLGKIHADAAARSGLEANFIEVLYLSDSIIVTVNDDEASRAVGAAMALAGYFQGVGGADRDKRKKFSTQLSYRGAISYGEYFIKRPFVIGPAVDEAASLMEAADAAIVWLTPSALPHYQEHFTDGAALPWSVPMKSGPNVETVAASPFPHTDNADEILQSILRTFQPAAATSSSVQNKLLNTERFLREALRLHRERAP